MERAAKSRLAWAIGGTAIGIALATVTVIWRPWQLALSADATNASLVAEGRAVYAARCASCHGKELEGQANWRERMQNGRLPAPPHDASIATVKIAARNLWSLMRAPVFEYSVASPAAGIVQAHGNCHLVEMRQWQKVTPRLSCHRESHTSRRIGISLRALVDP